MHVIATTLVILLSLGLAAPSLHQMSVEACERTTSPSVASATSVADCRPPTVSRAPLKLTIETTDLQLLPPPMSDAPLRAHLLIDGEPHVAGPITKLTAVDDGALVATMTLTAAGVVMFHRVELSPDCALSIDGTPPQGGMFHAAISLGEQRTYVLSGPACDGEIRMALPASEG